LSVWGGDWIRVAPKVDVGRGQPLPVLGYIELDTGTPLQRLAFFLLHMDEVVLVLCPRQVEMYLSGSHSDVEPTMVAATERPRRRRRVTSVAEVDVISGREVEVPLYLRWL